MSNNTCGNNLKNKTSFFLSYVCFEEKEMKKLVVSSAHPKYNSIICYVKPGSNI